MSDGIAEHRFEIAKLLLAQRDEAGVAEALLGRMLELTGAHRGFVVTREGDQFAPLCAVRFDAEGDGAEARFSRTLVRLALFKNELVYSASPSDDPELSALESIAATVGHAVVVAPLKVGDEQLGALYLQHPRSGGFTPDALDLVEDIVELASLSLRSLIERTAIAKRFAALERELVANNDFAGIVTRDPAMLELMGKILQIAPSKASVIVTGESGTGKELVARSVHNHSPRRDQPFVAVNCSAFPASTLEGELFGHVRGAFTGAERDRAGRFGAAHKGTLFLDEVAEIPLEMQAKLLRAVQFGEIQRLGTDKVERVDVRIVAATHANLRERVESGRFREDLYYRLRVVELHVPPLRSRPGDVLLLASHFASKLGDATLSLEALRALEAYTFPGNVRELAHAVERAYLLRTGPDIAADGLPAEILEAAARAPVARAPAAGRAPTFVRFDKQELEEATERALRDLERTFVAGLLERYGGNVTRAAAESGIHRSQLQKLMARVRT